MPTSSSLDESLLDEELEELSTCCLLTWGLNNLSSSSDELSSLLLLDVLGKLGGIQSLLSDEEKSVLTFAANEDVSDGFKLLVLGNWC